MLGGAEGGLDRPQLLVAQHRLRAPRCRGRHWCAAQKPRRSGHAPRPRPDRRKTAGAFGLEKAAIAGVADERFVASLQLTGETFEDRYALGGVLFCLLLVAADNVALPAESDRFGAVVDLIPAPGHGQRQKRCRIAEHDVAHELVGTLANAEDVESSLLDLLR